MTDQENDESLADWSHNPAYQQSPVDHFAPDRLPACSRRRAILLGLFLGLWGVQRFYLRKPGLGWVALVLCKGGIALGLVLMLVLDAWDVGLGVLILGPALAEAIGIADALGLASGRTATDGVGKPLGP